MLLYLYWFLLLLSIDGVALPGVILSVIISNTLVIPLLFFCCQLIFLGKAMMLDTDFTHLFLADGEQHQIIPNAAALLLNYLFVFLGISDRSAINLTPLKTNTAKFNSCCWPHFLKVFVLAVYTQTRLNQTPSTPTQTAMRYFP